MRTVLFTAAALFAAQAVLAQETTPFDMSKERPKDAPPIEQAVPAPVPPVAPSPPVAAPPVAVAPAPVVPLAPVAAPPAQPSRANTTPAVAPPASAPVAGGTAASPAATAAKFPRFLIPATEFGLAGELDRKTWSIYLTPEEAASPTKLNIAYQNAIVVAPEVSRLSVMINDRVVGQTPIQAPEKAAELSFDVPPGLLQAGSNTLSFQADQRHRTDCSLESTYELWTDLDPARTFLSFGGTSNTRLMGADAVRAVGVDEAGATQFNFVVPAFDQPGTVKPLMRLAQGLAVLSGMPNQSFQFSRTRLPASGPGKLTVLVGTAAELQPLVSTLPPAAQTAPLAVFVNDPRGGLPLLVVTGPTWQGVAEAIETLASPTDRSLDVARSMLVTQRWQSPDAPMIAAATDIPLSQLGVKTTQFSGRRFRTEFNVAVPADFYANAYGEATILLDAAYAATVLPGSHIDVFVNGSVASNVPITNAGGGIFRHLPIRVTLRHFRPGLNTVAIEAMLLTNDDKVCAPGASASTDPRFALFDTSVFHMPDFARVGQRPNLAATAGTGFPYSRADQPLPLFIDRLDEDTLSATATFLGKMAMMSSRPLPIELVTSPAAIGDRDALFVGAISQVPAAALAQLNIGTATEASWRPAAKGQTDEVDTTAAFEQWRSKVRNGSWTGQVSAFEEWMRRNFDISFNSLRFAPSAEAMFTPSNAATVMVAQGASPGGSGTWTVVTAPTSADLRTGITGLTKQDTWPDIAGHITTYAAEAKKLETVPVTRFDFVPTQGFSFFNYRLIAANWLSTNILSYAFLFVISSVVLGLATSALLSNLGRRR